MVTVITRVVLRDSQGEEWDAAMRDRMQAAESFDGWIGGHVLKPLDSPLERVIVGLWESRGAWRSWHEHPDFLETRERLNEMTVSPGEPVWHEVVYDARVA